MATSGSSSSAATPSLPPAAAKKGFLRRTLPFLFNASLVAVGVYVLARTRKKGPTEKDEMPSSPVVSTETDTSEKTVSTESLPLPAKARPPIPEHEQRELYKWILEEKRKVKPRDSTEKKKIDEEKALLKQVLRAESIPRL